MRINIIKSINIEFSDKQQFENGWLVVVFVDLVLH